MNFVFLSPHFPRNFYQFAQHLRRQGGNVLGIADTPWQSLPPVLQQSLTDYYPVTDMHDYEQLVRALGYFTQRHGKLDRVDSFSEYWLETEAALRTDFNLPGPNLTTIDDMKAKSLMKQKFIDAGVPVARGQIVRTLKEAVLFCEKVGLPVVAKPDIGVGGANTYKITNKHELETFFATKPDCDYFMEEFVAGTIETFDGLTDKDGNIVFCTSHVFSSGIMEAVNNAEHIFYYSQRQLPKDLEDAGRRTVAAYGLKERFFHIEFFRTHKDKSIVALEVNMRPPGGLSVDMFNYANDLDIYAEWANVVMHNRFVAKVERPYHVTYVSRKYHKNYVHSHEAIMAKYGQLVVSHQEIDRIFRSAIGDFAYLLRSPKLEDVIEAAHFIHREH